jgi:hypothetical protein
MEECLPHFLIRVFVVASRIVKGAKQFIPPTLFPTALHQLGEEDPHRVVVANRKPMRMLSHDCTFPLRTRILQPRSGKSARRNVVVDSRGISLAYRRQIE